MIRYIEEVIVPFVDKKKAELKLSITYPALAIFDCFTGQTTPALKSLLRKHHIRFIIVPPNCTDKLQPLDIPYSAKFSRAIYFANFLQVGFCEKKICE